MFLHRRKSLDQFNTLEDLENFIERAINESPELIERVRQFLVGGEDSPSLSDARLRNWREGKNSSGDKKRGIPELLTIGAALHMLAKEDELYPHKRSEVPHDLNFLCYLQERLLVVRSV
jgi:hypothetical protein